MAASPPTELVSLCQALRLQADHPQRRMVLVTRKVTVKHAGALLEAFQRKIGLWTVREVERVQALHGVDNLLAMICYGYLPMIRDLVVQPNANPNYFGVIFTKLNHCVMELLRKAAIVDMEFGLVIDHSCNNLMYYATHARDGTRPNQWLLNQHDEHCARLTALREAVALLAPRRAEMAEEEDVDAAVVMEMDVVPGAHVELLSLRSTLRLEALNPGPGTVVVTRSVIVDHAGALLEVFSRNNATWEVEEIERLQALHRVKNLLALGRDGYFQMNHNMLVVSKYTPLLRVDMTLDWVREIENAAAAVDGHFYGVIHSMCEKVRRYAQGAMDGTRSYQWLLVENEEICARLNAIKESVAILQPLE